MRNESQLRKDGVAERVVVAAASALWGHTDSYLHSEKYMYRKQLGGGRRRKRPRGVRGVGGGIGADGGVTGGLQGRPARSGARVDNAIAQADLTLHRHVDLSTVQAHRGVTVKVVAKRHAILN